MDEIDPWGSLDIEDYERTMDEFGIESFRKVKDKIPLDHRYFRRNIIYGQRDFDKILEAIEKDKKFAMMTGLMPSGKFHFGHKIVADQFLIYQELGAELYIAVADIEAYLTRDMPLDKCRELAVEEYLANYLALGLKPENLNFYFQSEGSSNYHTMSKLFSKNVTKNEIGAIYGDINPGKIMSIMTQVADILQPQFEENGGPKPVVVPVGTDQDPHIRLTRDVASRFSKKRFKKPASTYHKFMRGLQGGKMSSSDEKSYISVSEPIEQSLKKIDQAKTGGRKNKKEHIEKGAKIEEDMVFEMLACHLIEDDERLKEIRRKYSSGEMLSGELKQICKEELKTFLRKHQEKLEKNRKKAEEMVYG